MLQTTLNKLAVSGLIRRHKNIFDQYRNIQTKHNKFIKELENFFTEMPDNNETDLETIIRLVNDEFDIDCTLGSRKREVVYARHCAVYLMRNYTNFTWTNIANAVKTSHHTTAIHSANLCKDLMKIDEDYNFRVQRIQKILNESKKSTSK